MNHDYKLFRITIIMRDGKKSKYLVTAKNKEDAKQEVIQKAKITNIPLSYMRCEVVSRAVNIP